MPDPLKQVEVPPPPPTLDHVQVASVELPIIPLVGSTDGLPRDGMDIDLDGPIVNIDGEGGPIVRIPPVFPPRFLQGNRKCNKDFTSKPKMQQGFYKQGKTHQQLQKRTRKIYTDGKIARASQIAQPTTNCPKSCPKICSECVQTNRAHFGIRVSTNYVQAAGSKFCLRYYMYLPVFESNVRRHI